MRRRRLYTWVAAGATALGFVWLLGDGPGGAESSVPRAEAPGDSDVFAARPVRSIASVPPASDGGLRAPTVQGGIAHTRVSAPDMLQELLEGSRLQGDWLASHGFTPNSAALRRLHELLDGHASLLSSQARPIAFGPREGTSVLAPGAVPVLAPQERYVHAVMPAQGWGGDSVLVRWRNVSDNTVMELSAQAIAPGVGEGLPLWQFAAEDWSPGRYRVEVISPGADLALLAAGEFEIASPGMRVTPFASTSTAVGAP